MSTYQFKTSLEELKLGYAEFVQSTTRVDEMNRADIVMARLAGASTSTLAELYGYSVTQSVPGSDASTQMVGTC